MGSAHKEFRRKDGSVGRIRVESVGKRRAKGGVPPSPSPKPVASLVPSPEVEQPKPPPSKEQSGGVLGWILSGLGLAALLGVGGYVLLDRRKQAAKAY